MALVPSVDRVDVAGPSVSSSEDEGVLEYNPSAVHKRRLKRVKAIEKRLNQRDGLNSYEIAGSFLDHSKADLIRERSDMPVGFALAMLEAEDRAHEPPKG